MKNIEIKRFGKLNEEKIEIPIRPGFYIVINDFSIDPGGAWRIRFRKGQILKYYPNHKLERYNPIAQNWNNVSPPIQGVENFDLTRYGFDGTQRQMYGLFMDNTSSISKSKMDELISGMTREIVVKVKDIQKTIDKLGLSPNQEVKIIL